MEGRMSQRTLLRLGAAKILDAKNNVLGFAFSEASAEGQLQRWILRRRSRLFSIVPWERDITLSRWKEMIAQPASNVDEWGARPDDGLWLPDAIYIVAKSTIYSYGTDGAYAWSALPWPPPPPSFCYNDDAASLSYGAEVTEASAEGAQLTAAQPSENLVAAPIGSTLKARALAGRQVDIGDRVIYQIDRIAGHVFAEGGLGKPANTNTWRSVEHWLLFGSYQPAGASGLTTALRAGELAEDAPLSAFYSAMTSQWSSGCSFEITGCNNYQGASPPPANRN
jgi:hypothetical protein